MKPAGTPTLRWALLEVLVEGLRDPENIDVDTIVERIIVEALPTATRCDRPAVAYGSGLLTGHLGVPPLQVDGDWCDVIDWPTPAGVWRLRVVGHAQ